MKSIHSQNAAILTKVDSLNSTLTSAIAQMAELKLDFDTRLENHESAIIRKIKGVYLSEE